MSTTYNSIYLMQAQLLDLGFDPGPLNGVFGEKTSSAMAAWQKSLAIDTEGLPELTGDGTWPFTAFVDGEDLVLKGVKANVLSELTVASSFSDLSGPNENIQACALPVIYTGVDAHLAEAFAGSPLPEIPWNTPVVVTVNGVAVEVPVIDVGPEKESGAAISLTLGAARIFKADAEVDDFTLTCDYRIIGGAQYVEGSV